MRQFSKKYLIVPFFFTNYFVGLYFSLNICTLTSLFQAKGTIFLISIESSGYILMSMRTNFQKILLKKKFFTNNFVGLYVSLNLCTLTLLFMQIFVFLLNRDVIVYFLLKSPRPVALSLLSAYVERFAVSCVRDF